MGGNTSVTLGENCEKFISNAIEGGLYGSTSEAIGTGLQLFEEHEIKLKILRNGLIKGEQSGSANYSLEDLDRELDEITG